MVNVYFSMVVKQKTNVMQKNETKHCNILEERIISLTCVLSPFSLEWRISDLLEMEVCRVENRFTQTLYTSTLTETEGERNT